VFAALIINIPAAFPGKSEWVCSAESANLRAIKDCQLSIKDGRIEIESIGNDPYFEIDLKTPVKSGWIEFKLALASSAPGEGQLFWLHDGETSFSEKQSVALPIQR